MIVRPFHHCFLPSSIASEKAKDILILDRLYETSLFFFWKFIGSSLCLQCKFMVMCLGLIFFHPWSYILSEIFQSENSWASVLGNFYKSSCYSFSIVFLFPSVWNSYYSVVGPLGLVLWIFFFFLLSNFLAFALFALLSERFPQLDLPNFLLRFSFMLPRFSFQRIIFAIWILFLCSILFHKCNIFSCI